MSNIIKKYIDESDGIIILAGAGMGVDAGIPDFRGKTGLWTQEKGIFLKHTLGSAFFDHPLDTWNFFISRFLNYKNITPHSGYYDLLKLKDYGKDLFVVTSNVDGHFKKSGYDPEKLYEIHGNLEWLQCSKLCCRDTIKMPSFTSIVDSIKDLPHCEQCGAVMRPMVMLFNDPAFYPKYTSLQSIKFLDWSSDKINLLGIEIGAGLAVASIRVFGNDHTRKLIRINPHDHQIYRKDDISIPQSAINGIRLILESLN